MQSANSPALDTTGAHGMMMTMMKMSINHKKMKTEEVEKEKMGGWKRRGRRIVNIYCLIYS